MIEIDHTTLSETALENLIIEVITRETTDYGEYETDIQMKKAQLLRQLNNGVAVIVYSPEESVCDIIKAEDFKKFALLQS
ncbi:MAG: YheU family protein [Legionellales bacterium]